MYLYIYIYSNADNTYLPEVIRTEVNIFIHICKRIPEWKNVIHITPIFKKVMALETPNDIYVIIEKTSPFNVM